MRRTDKEINDPALLRAFLESAHVIHLAINSKVAPYILATNFVYQNNSFFIHSSVIGRKIDLLRLDPNVGFAVDEFIKIAPADTACAHGARFKSAVGIAIASFIIDKAKKISTLNELMRKFTGKGDYSFSDNMIDKTEVIELNIIEISYKADLRGL